MQVLLLLSLVASIYATSSLLKGANARKQLTHAKFFHPEIEQAPVLGLDEDISVSGHHRKPPMTRDGRRTGPVHSAPTIVPLGGYCFFEDSDFCMIGLLCNPNNTCVGPAATGQSCTALASAHMCVNGNWCNCTSQTACTCVAEVGDSSPCEHDYQCKGGSGCNLGTCTKFFSVPRGQNASDYKYCELQLAYNVSLRQCVSLTEKSCTVSLDCTNGGIGVTDPIFYECNSGKCGYNGPDCWYFLYFEFANVKYNNYYDRSQPRVSVSLYEKYAECVYGKYIAHGAKPTPGQLLTQAEEHFLNTQTHWANTGDSCAGDFIEQPRCMIGSYCGNNTCRLYPRENQPCGLNPNNVDDTAPFAQCDVQEYLVCSQHATDETPYYVGPLGTCIKGTQNTHSTCRTETAMHGDMQVTLNTGICDKSDSYYCRVTDGVGTNNQSGNCEQLGTLPAGQNTTWGLFCKNALWFDSHAQYPQCLTFEQAHVTCTVWEDCTGYTRGYYGMYGNDYHIVDEPIMYGWEYYSLFETQVACVNNVCQYTGPDNCQSQYENAVQFTSQNSDSPPTCPYVKCQLKNYIAPGYVPCVAEYNDATLSRSTSPFLVFFVGLMVSLFFY